MGYSEAIHRFLDGIGGNRLCGWTGKKKYRTEAAATHAAQLVERKEGKMSTYQCGACLEWHYGHQRQKIKGGLHAKENDNRKHRRGAGPHRADPHRAKS